jgi:hypothetical protein
MQEPLCGAPAELGGGVAVACTRHGGHPPPHEAPVVLHHGGVCVQAGRVQWPHQVWPVNGL